MIYLISNQTKLFESELISFCSQEVLIEWLKDKKEIEIDTETEGGKLKGVIPDPYRYKMLCIQVGNFDNQFVIDTLTVNIDFLKPYIDSPNICKVFWNAFFDLRFLFHKGFNPKNVYDGFLAEMVLTLNKKLPKGYRGLKESAYRYLEINLDKEIRSQIHWRGLDTEVTIYAANDVKYLGKIKEKQLKEIEKNELTKALELQNKFITSLAKMAYKGIKLDSNSWIKLAELNKKRLINKLYELEKLVSDTYPKEINLQLDLFGSASSRIDWDSPKKVANFFNKIKIPIEVVDKKTGEFKDSTEQKNLKKYEKDFPILKVFFEYKEFQKSCNTYGLNFLKWINPITIRIHGEFFPILKTGRISSNNPNLQNIPSDKEYRSCFIAEEGNVFIICDYSQQEPRITADKCLDPTLVNLFLEGDGDTHSNVASKMYSIILGKEVEITKNNPYIEVKGVKRNGRQDGKILNLKLDYGGSAYTVKDDLGVTEEEAQVFIEALKKVYPKKEEYMQKVIKKSFKDGFITIDEVTKLKSYMPDMEKLKALENKPKEEWTKGKGGDWSNYYKLKGGMERDCKNYPIQGSAGNMSKLAMIYVDREIERIGLLDKAFIVNAIHDEIIVECNVQVADILAPIISDCMVKAGKVFCKTVPMVVEPEIYNYWKK